MEAIMSTISSVSPQTRGISGQSWTDHLMTTLKGWLVAYLTWRLEQAAITELLSLSDRTLKDIGLTRSGIPCAVMGDTAKPESTLP
jgi:uncharacterized protein YjiS (DUF1127 family)